MNETREIRYMRPRMDVEGSRGGKIIGHTSSGKPIYMTKTSVRRSLRHFEFTPKEHREAAEQHRDILRGKGFPGARDKPTTHEGVVEHEEHISFHVKQANQKQLAKSKRPPE